jgi:molybdopterin/thiamine biosynthesis adenylyltransferase
MEGRKPLTDAERDQYSWQITMPAFAERGQEKLKGASVLITRCGGVGSVAAMELAAAGVGRIVLAHAGNIRANDLNRQILMTHAGIGKPRVESAARLLYELNPHIEVETVAENVTEDNVAQLVGRVDAMVICAPLFRERLLLNREAFAQRKPLVDCAMFEWEGQVTTIVPGQTPCLACLYPTEPVHWQRRFPVFGAVAGMIGCLGAVEMIKLLADVGQPLLSKMLLCDLQTMAFRKVAIQANPDCAVCGQKC